MRRAPCLDESLACVRALNLFLAATAVACAQDGDDDEQHQGDESDDDADLEDERQEAYERDEFLDKYDEQRDERRNTAQPACRHEKACHLFKSPSPYRTLNLYAPCARKHLNRNPDGSLFRL